MKTKIRKKMKGIQDRPRLVVFRSIKHIYAQLIDDENFKTLLSVSSKNKEIAEQLKDVKSQVQKSKIVGLKTAEKAISQNIKKVVFDRNGYLYHGRVKALAEGAREGGLIF